MTPKNHILFSIPLCFFIILKSVNRELYYSYINFQSTAGDVIDYFDSIPGGKKLFKHNYGYAIIAYLEWFDSDYSNNNLDKYNKIVEDPNSEKEEIYKAQRIIEIVQSFWRKNNKAILGVIVKKIEMLEKFSF